MTEASERPTLVPCLVCDGAFRIVESTDAPAPKGTSKHWRVTRCPWCSDGAMSPEQVQAWIKAKALRVPPIPRED